jgi:hypothetical protein
VDGECKAVAKALAPHAAAGMRLANVRRRDGRIVVVLRSARRYDGEWWQWNVPVKPEEADRNPRRVMRLLCEEARRDMDKHHVARKQPLTT